LAKAKKVVLEAVAGIVTIPKVNVLVNVAMQNPMKVNQNVLVKVEQHH
jgi:hypothetical protein